MSLEGAKKGDLIYWKNWYAFGAQRLNVEPVARTTKTQIITKSGHRFYRLNGHKVGSSGSYRANVAQTAQDEHIEAYNHQQLAARVESMFKGVGGWPSLSDRHLEQIAAVFQQHEEEQDEAHESDKGG